MSQTSRKSLAVVVPVYNEAQGLDALHARVSAVMNALPYDWQLILVDDGSRDHSWPKIREIAARDPKVKGLMLSRNFGKEMALTAGVELCPDVDAVICLDADLQHPPELIPTLTAKWEEGYEIVATVREAVADYSPMKKFGSKAFYWVMTRYSDLDIPPSSTDFRLLDRKVVRTLLQFTERTRMFRGLIDWMGFKKTYIPFVAPARDTGQVGYSFKKLFNLAVNSFTSFSLLPLRFTGYLGLTIIGVALCCLAFMSAGNVLWGANYTPMAFFTVFNTFLIGIVLCGLGMVSLYIGHIHTEVVQRPLYIIRERAGRWE
ncbi:putative glycosyltransferase [Fundidesulfovibrio magnetotacticus]|uniref:Putative glycosyltransferase n=1 Tax=Fundidesulfovibrio magnetotacticus TaxID=2730080 RepID=A0A6V8LU99_9BACT|nr:glycosyltransferase family 2 protein [Fundidesulfovibrio magnetotacticus]GFK95983.1 putative glycosyltransferase [Fundidesulfovibrio magnetotacticus]